MKSVMTCAIALTAVIAVATPAKAQTCGEEYLSDVICGVVWNDLNADGIQNDSALLPGVIVTLYDLSDGTSSETTTNEIGFYVFEHVPVGTYKIVVSPPSTGMEPTCLASDPSCPSSMLGDPFLDSDGHNDAGSSFVTNVVRTETSLSQKLDFGFVSTGVVSPGTGTPGYWKNHTEEWAKSGLLNASGEITVGIETFTPEEAAALMGKVSKDKRISLFAALVSAMLNVGIGNDPSCISGYITGGNNWMKDHPFATTAPSPPRVRHGKRSLRHTRNSTTTTTVVSAHRTATKSSELRREPRPGSGGSFRRVQQPARAIGKGRAGNRSVARSCRPPVCSDHCSTYRKAPSVRPCTDRRGVRTWQLRP